MCRQPVRIHNNKTAPDLTPVKEGAKFFIEKSINKGYVDYAGDDLDGLLPPTSRRGGAREKKKESVLEKIRRIVEVFVGI